MDQKLKIDTAWNGCVCSSLDILINGAVNKMLHNKIKLSKIYFN